MEYRIDGKQMHTRQEAHDEIARAMEFPEYYGRNLDALWDMLTSTAGSAVLTDVSGMLNALGSYGCRLLKTFYDAAEENSRFDFRVE
ncbi:MAG: barstar family protein [Clostridia bacterium]|nr:barstar family protein [Clostridia bacterium]